MRRIILILAPLLFILELNAKDLSSNSTFHQYSKPGAPIDMHYTSEKVDINETCDVNITLTTAITKGTVSALISLDKNLSSLNEFDQNLTFEIMPNQQDFLINLQVKSEHQGLYYIRLLTKVDKGYGVKLRSFAVPVYIGKEAGIMKKSISSHMKALGSGENISVSKAVETIEVVKEK
jgi:hypothetical protein